MNFYSKKGIYVIIGLFIAWTIISTFWYVCGIKGFCQTTIINKNDREFIDNDNELDVNNDEWESPIKKVSKTVLECDTYLGKNLNKEEIKKLQLFLNEFDGKNLVVDGLYGSDTKKAVIDFQNENYDEIGVNNGDFGEETRYQINKDYCINEFNKINKK